MMDPEVQKAHDDFFAGVQRFFHQCEAEGQRLEAYFRRFDAAITSEDITGICVKGHLFIENEMVHCLRTIVPRHDASKLGLSFRQKLDLLYAMAVISDDEWASYKTFNNIRNSIAHDSVEDRVPEVTPQQVQDLWNNRSLDSRDMYDDNTSPSADPREALREMMLIMMILLHVRSKTLGGEFGYADTSRYYLTSETVMDRQAKAREAEQFDNEAVRNAKDVIGHLRMDDRRNVRLWMAEMYHVD